ncbi:MAG: type I restriction endonuclease EcoAI subunit S [Candidatus Woesearchaeota archaeon]|nr:MAG: type I restriction endonuclease EcoAI subunit S [Candidatus Woesearchaeota archaeon]
MNLLFENLEKLIDAPNGIEKARELILQLAVQGKLVKQDPNDEPASELLKKIKKEKERLIAEGKIRRQRELPPIKDEEKPFELPKGWKFEKVGNIAEFINGVTYSKSESLDSPFDDYLPILRANNINGKINLNGLVYIPKKKVSERQLVKKYDNIIAMSSGSKSLVGKSAQLLFEFEGSFGAFCGVLRFYEGLNNGYLNYFLQSPYYRTEISRSSQGIGINNLRKDNLLKLIIPLPPLNEQKRIVEKVNSLMALLDEIEEKRERRNQKRIKLNNASLNKLITSKDDIELKSNWKRIEENFNLLYSEPENVEKLKQAILQLAVQGKLVKQDPNDVPASELLKKIKKEKERLIAEGKIRRQRELPPIRDEEKPFELPKGWEWGRIGSLFDLKTGATPSTAKKQYYGGNIKWLVSGDIHKGEIFDCDGRITEEGLRNSNCKLIPINSVLIALNGQGKTRATVAILRTVAACNQSLVAMTPIGEYIMPEYLYYNLKGRYYEIRDITGRKQRRGLNMGIVGSLIFSIPPFNEQKRIVEKVNELMSLCNTLEEKLKQKEAEAVRLVGAVVNEITNSKSVNYKG